MTTKPLSPGDKHSQLTLDPPSTLGDSNSWAQFTGGKTEAQKSGECQVLDLFSEVLQPHLTEQKQIP